MPFFHFLPSVCFFQLFTFAFLENQIYMSENIDESVYKYQEDEENKNSLEEK